MTGVPTPTTGPCVSGAAAPSSALLLPELADQAPRALAALGRAVVAGLAAVPPHDEAVVLVAGAPGSGIRLHRGDATLAGLGLPALGAASASEVAELAAPLTARLAERGTAPADGVVLAALLRAAGHTRPPVLLAVDPNAVRSDHLETGAALAAWAEGRPHRTVLLLAAGDLSAAHGPDAPLPGREGAAALDAALVRGLADVAPAALADSGPEQARRLGVRGWAPLTVLAAALAAAGARPPRVEIHRPRGVTYLFALGPS